MRAAEPLVLSVTEEARRQTTSARIWLRGFGSEVEKRFTNGLERELKGLCQRVAQQIADKKPFHPDEQASLIFSRAIYRHRFQTARHARNVAVAVSGFSSTSYAIKTAMESRTPSNFSVCTMPRPVRSGTNPKATQKASNKSLTASWMPASPFS